MWVDQQSLKESYDELKQKCALYRLPIHILFAPTVDSLCATKLLTALFIADQIPYQLYPVHGYQSLKRSIEHSIQTHALNVTSIYSNSDFTIDFTDTSPPSSPPSSPYHSDFPSDSSSSSGLTNKPLLVFLVNCGAVVNLHEYLNLSNNKNITLYVIDSNRPLDLNNISEDNQQVIMWCDGQDRDRIPDIENLSENFNPDSSSEDDFYESSPKRRKRDTVAARTEREAHLEDVISNYYRSSYHGISTSFLLLDLIISNNQAQVSMNIMWWAIIGITDHFLKNRIPITTYLQMYSQCVEYVKMDDKPKKSSLYGVPTGAGSLSPTIGQIDYEPELRLQLLRHSSLYDAFYYSIYFQSKMKLYTDYGVTELQKIFVQIGLKLSECKQSWTFMREENKLAFLERWEEKIQSEGNKWEHATFRSFIKQYTPTFQLSASDAVHILDALLIESVIEDGESLAEGDRDVFEDKMYAHRMNKALDALSGKRIETIKAAIEESQRQTKEIINIGTKLLSNRTAIKNTTHFRYSILDESQSLSLIASPLALSKLAYFVQFAQQNELVETDQSESHSLKRTKSQRKNARKPLVLCCPKPNKGTYLVIGVSALPPATSTSNEPDKNPFGTYFRLAADAIVKHSGLTAQDSEWIFVQDGFENIWMEINRDKLKDFLGHLIYNVTMRDVS